MIQSDEDLIICLTMARAALYALSDELEAASFREGRRTEASLLMASSKMTETGEDGRLPEMTQEINHLTAKMTALKDCLESLT